MATTILRKPHRGAHIGMKLDGRPEEPPVITEVEGDSIAESCALKVGMRLLKINDQPTYGPKMGMDLLRMGQGDLTLRVSLDDAVFHASSSDAVNGLLDGADGVDTVLLHKPDKSSRTGIVLKGVDDTPIVSEIKPGGLAAASPLAVGMRVLAINDKPVVGHVMGTNLLKDAAGTVRIRVERSAPQAVPAVASPVQPSSPLRPPTSPPQVSTWSSFSSAAPCWAPTSSPWSQAPIERSSPAATSPAPAQMIAVGNGLSKPLEAPVSQQPSALSCLPQAPSTGTTGGGAANGGGLGEVAPLPDSTDTVILHKPDKTARTGIVLTGVDTTPIVSEIKPGGLAAASPLAVGMRVLAINDKLVVGHVMGTTMLKEAAGLVHIRVERLQSPTTSPEAERQVQAVSPSSPPKAQESSRPARPIPFQHKGETLMLIHGPAPPFAVYERDDSIKIVISTFNMSADVNEGDSKQSDPWSPQRASTELLCSVNLRLDDAKMGEACFFQSAWREEGSADPLSRSHCKMDIVRAAYLTDGVKVTVSSTRVKLILPKAAWPKFALTSNVWNRG